MYSLFFKRLIDLLVALVVVLMCIIPLLIVACLIKIDSKGPVFYNQLRVGKDLKIFKVLKFRTMTNEKRDVPVKIIGRAEGVTKVGYYLRRYKIDELPQVLNVLAGQMSLVGPRPSVPEHLLKMTDEEKKRYNVHPGLTGVAQVSGGVHLPWSERFQLDLKYVRNISFYNDVLILIRTVSVVLLGEEKFINKPLRLKMVAQ